MDFTHIDYMLTINRLAPIVAIFLTLIALFGRRFITKDCVSSSILHLTIIFWVMLVWADWGSQVFHPSKQTVIARCLMVVILWLVVLLIKNYSKLFRQLKKSLSDAVAKLDALTKLYEQAKSDNQALSDENKQLKKLLQEEIIQGGCLDSLPSLK
jgi:type VI protein secretion system component VasK